MKLFLPTKQNYPSGQEFGAFLTSKFNVSLPTELPWYLIYQGGGRGGKEGAFSCRSMVCM